MLGNGGVASEGCPVSGSDTESCPVLSLNTSQKGKRLHGPRVFPSRTDRVSYLRLLDRLSIGPREASWLCFRRAVR